MLKRIISITGKPGLFKILSQGKNSIIVEDITTGHRMPAGGRDKIVALGDIAMYTDSGDEPLSKILEKLHEKTGGNPIDVKGMASRKGVLREYFSEIVPDHDQDRVYESDIKKLFSWYNLLLAAGMTNFAEEEETTQEEEKPAEEAEK